MKGLIKLFLSKQELIEEFFTYGDVTDGKDIKARIKRLKFYLANHDYDSEIVYMMLFVEADRTSYATNDFEKCVAIARPVFDLLKEPRCNNISFVEVIVLAKLISFAPTFDVVKTCEQTVYNLLETKFKHEKLYNTVRFILSTAIVSRLVAAKYFSANGSKSEASREELFELFKKHSVFCDNIFTKNKLPRLEACYRIHEGMFHRNAQLVEDSLLWLRKHERKKWYPTMTEEFIKFSHIMEGELTQTLLDIVAGYYITKIREERGIKQVDVADDISIAPETLSKIENGRSTASAMYLYKLSHLFGVDVSYFFTGKKLY